MGHSSGLEPIDDFHEIETMNAKSPANNASRALTQSSQPAYGYRCEKWKCLGSLLQKALRATVWPSVSSLPSGHRIFHGRSLRGINDAEHVLDQRRVPARQVSPAASR